MLRNTARESDSPDEAPQERRSNSAPCRTNLLLAHKVSKVVYEPLGVVAAIVSWNYPFRKYAAPGRATESIEDVFPPATDNLISPMIAALATGNAIVVKPSENVAWSSLIFVQAIRDCLAACGEDPELVQIVITLPESVEALTGDARLKHITFVSARVFS